LQQVLLGGGGCLWRVDDTLTDGRRAKTLMRFHSGRINDIVASPADHFSATAGEDGTVRCWDYVDRNCLFESKFPTAATSITWAPQSLDSDARTVAVGFQSGVVRILYRAQRQWKVVSVMKPHDGMINSISYSPDGKIMATCGSDRKIFFLSSFSSEGNSPSSFTYDPIGFVCLEENKGIAKKLNWRHDSKCVLVSYASSGEAVEIGLPGSVAGSELNTHESFNVTDTCSIRSHIFTAKPTIGGGLAAAVAKPEDGDEAGDIENPFEQMKVEKLSIVNAIYVPKQENKILVTVASSTFNYDDEAPSTMIHACEFGKEYSYNEFSGHNKTCGGNLNNPKGSTEVLRFSSSRKIFLSGGGDGATMVRSVVDQEGGSALGVGKNIDLSELSSFYVNVSMHSSELPEQTVTGATTSFDDKYLLTTGSRGGFFSFRIRYDELEKHAQSAADGRAKELAAKAAKAGLVSTATVTSEMDASMDEVFGNVSSSVPSDFHDDEKESKMKEAVDLENPDEAYSIEDAKLKTEEDNKRREANKKKDGVRQAIIELRGRYMKLFHENKNSPVEQRLNQEEVALDMSVVQRLVSAGDSKCEEVEKILRWESEKNQLAVEKLQEKFLSNVAVEGIELKTFRKKMTVRSFRTTALPDTLQESLRAVHALIDAEDDARRRAGKLALLNKEGKGNNGKKNAKFASDSPKKGGKEGEAMDERTQEARKLLRQKRRGEYAEMMSKKPDLGEEDPDDLAAIEDTRTNLGDYKLKTAANYVVPEDQRVNAEKKKRQMVLLEESIHSIKMGYNQRFLALRDLKRRIIDNVSNDNVRIRSIDKELKQLEIIAGNDVEDMKNLKPLWEPKIDPREWPEERFKVTPEELAAELGITTSTDKKSTNIPSTGSGASGAASGAATNNAVASSGSEIDQIPQLRAASSLFTVPDDDSENIGGEDESSMEIALREERKMTLLHERKILLDKTNQTVIAFDEAMYDLRREKVKLDADLKTAEMRMLTFLNELDMLKEFEVKDKSLSTKLEKSKIEKGTISTEIAECKVKLTAKRQEIEVWQEKDKVIEAEFANLVPESNALWPQLFKIFKRKIKRTKKSQGGDGSDDEDSDYESSEAESSDGDSDDEDEDDSCPVGCDQALYDKVLELREKRLDQEDVLTDFQKNIDDLKKTFERLSSRERTIGKELTSTEKDIELFQTEKQKKLNTLDVYVTVQLSQILHMIAYSDFNELNNAKKSGSSSPSRSPMRRMMSDTASVLSSTVGGDHDIPPEYVLLPDMSSGVVFSRESITKLKHRIVGVHEETAREHKKFRNLHKEKKKLYREKKTRNQLITASEEKCNDLQMLKFGQTIDLESLDKMGSTQALDEVNNKKKRLEIRQGTYAFCLSLKLYFSLKIIRID
jgi:cilia- and flagella-associated protein 44